jgi:hypothetical protein
MHAFPEMKLNLQNIMHAWAWCMADYYSNMKLISLLDLLSNLNKDCR